MIRLKDKYEIIQLKIKGLSNREVAKKTSFDRKTVARYWYDYLSQVEKLDGEEVLDAQEVIVDKPRYDTSSRKPRKYSPEIDGGVMYHLLRTFKNHIEEWT